jgi:hypothetical protein
VIISAFEEVWGHVIVLGFCEEQCASCVEGVPPHISKHNSQPQRKTKNPRLVAVCCMAIGQVLRLDDLTSTSNAGVVEDLGWGTVILVIGSGCIYRFSWGFYMHWQRIGNRLFSLYSAGCGYRCIHVQYESRFRGSAPLLYLTSFYWVHLRIQFRVAVSY